MKTLIRIRTARAKERRRYNLQKGEILQQHKDHTLHEDFSSQILEMNRPQFQ